MLRPGLIRAMEGAVELEFCDEEGDITASHEELYQFLLEEEFAPEEIKEYLNLYF